MTTLTHDASASGPGSTSARRSPSTDVRGLQVALVSAISFGLSGALVRPMLDADWSPSAIVLVRIGVAALALLVPGLAACRRMPTPLRTLRRAGARLVTFGVLSVAVCQFCYFSAVARMDVGPALLIEYTAPALVVVWLWGRHGQRPGGLTVAGAALCAVGLVLVLGVLTGAVLSPAGVAWAAGATVTNAYYFIVSADDRGGLPPMVLAAGGMLVGTVVLALAGLAGLLPMHASSGAVHYAGAGFDLGVAWWVPALVLGLVTAALAYVTGIASTRVLGSRVASFVALSEVVAGVGWAWLLVDQLPGPLQLLGGVVILVGVIAVKLGERGTVGPAAADVRPDGTPASPQPEP